MNKQLLGFISFSGRFTLMSAERSCRKFSSTRLYNFILLLFSVLVLSVSLGIHGEARASALEKTIHKDVENPYLAWSVRYVINQGVILIKIRSYYHTTYQGNDATQYEIKPADLKISTDGTNFATIGTIDFNSNTSYKPQGNYTSSATTDYSVANQQTLTITLNVDSLNSKIKKIRVQGSWFMDEDHHNNDIRGLDESLNISFDQMTGINKPTYEFLNSGKTRISYTKQDLTSMDSVSTMQLISDKTYNLGPDSSSGSIDIPFSNSKNSYYFMQSAFNGRIIKKSKNISIPAFIEPNNAYASFDNYKTTGLLHWDIVPFTGNSADVVKDKYKIEVADNAGFNHSQQLFAEYDPALSSDTIPISNLGPDLYIRIARDHPEFDWSLGSKIVHLQITIDPINSKTVGLVLHKGNAALISWVSLKSAWIPGGSFLITRQNKSTHVNSIITLTLAQYQKGSYTDENIELCNEYTYSLQVVPPPNSAFVALAAIQVPNSVIPTQASTIEDMTASRGYFPDRTELSWSSNGLFDSFIIKRAIYGTKKYTVLPSVPGTAAADYQVDDTKGTPGVYYSYMIIGAKACNKTNFYSDTLYAIGFRSPTGTILGKIIYANGQPVENVSVRLQGDAAITIGKSIYLNGSPQSFLKVDSLFTPFTDSAFTVEAWIKPYDLSPKNQVLFSKTNQYELGFNGDGSLYFAAGSGRVIAPYLNSTHSFIHITGIHKKDSLLIMINDSVLTRIPYTSQASAISNPSLYVGGKSGGNNFKGFITEVRVWNTGLNEKTIARNYTRMLAGNENGLAAYWRFNETIADRFYDLSHNSDVFNQNDGHMDPLNVSRTDTMPKPGQLSLKGYSDISGNYQISGIPYKGNGTTYTIVPILGTHQFDPSNVNKLISGTSPEFTVDFTDKSSFPVSGSIYYSNSTVPVKGVQFKIDGQYAQQKDGTIIQTDATGAFSLSVPVGIHEVKAVENNHFFENGGKITDMAGNNLNYQGPVSQRILRDRTTIRFIGRVAGGAVQEAFPLGHSMSVNNLGQVASINLALTSGTKFDLYSGQGTSTSKTVYINHLLPSNQTDSGKIHRSRIIYKTNNIIIYPDSLTGEFEADLIPENFIADQVNVTGWDNLIDGNTVSLDFTNKFFVTSVINTYKDSSQTGKGAYKIKNYSDSVRYNASYKFIKRVMPTVSFTQQGSDGKEVSYFGEKTYKPQAFLGNSYSIPLIDSSKSDRTLYRYGNPVFLQAIPYKFIVKAFEVYNFYDHITSDGTKVIKTVNGLLQVSNVPTKDGQVNILNNIENGPVGVDTLSLDANGKGVYSFTAGDPDLAASGLKNFSASVKFGPATTVNWNWYQNAQMPVYVMGANLSGTTFITAGPDELLMVLRDPPGSTSFSTASNGTIISNSTTYSGAVNQVGDDNVKEKLGAELVTFTGVGVGVINSAVNSTGAGLSVHHEEHYTNTNTKLNTTTLTTSFQTSADPGAVGAPADLFVGYSTNITYGQSNNITMIKRTELKSADTKVYEPDSLSTYLVVLRKGINMGETFGTLFAFPQSHIQSVLIPNLLAIRNILLLPPGTSSSAAQALANASKKQIYISKLGAGDPNFGKSNRDTSAFGKTALTRLYSDGLSYKIYFPSSTLNRTDTISTLNQYVSKWKQRMSDNEKAKLESSLLQNYSFHAGNPVTYSRTTTHNETSINDFNIIISGSVSASTDFEISGSGFSYDFVSSIGTQQGGTFTSSTENDQTLGFTLSSAGSDDYFSVDVNQAKDNSFVFRTKGGVSGCPYEGANKTVYYQPGTGLDQPTQRIEVPKISVDKPVVNDIPTMRTASYTLFLKNESEAKIDGSFNISYADNDSIRGATISIDGTPIGGSGRIITVPYGQVLEKVLTIAKGPQAMDYNNLQIILKSGCQSSIADTVLLSAHFIPSCSEIHVKSPTDNWVVNTQSAINTDGNRFLPITLDQFDVNNSLFDHIELQYKPASESSWITGVKFFADKNKLAAAEGKSMLITNAQAINYNLVMDDASFNDQSYTVRAVSYCNLGASNYVTTESNLISGIKDTYNPRLFGSPQPANGLLGISDEIRLKFNKDIASGLLTNTDFQVTGIRNGVSGDHTVSVNLDGIGNYLQTEFNKNFIGKSITTEVWVLPDKPANQTLISQGNLNESMEIALTADNYLQLTVGKKIIKSIKPVSYKPAEWAHIAMVYNASDTTVSGFYNFSEIISHEHVPVYEGVGAFQFGRSISKAGNYFAGKMHRVAVWSAALPATTIQINSLIQLSGAENNLLGYYPMDEGKGIVCLDKAHGSNASLLGVWSTPPGKAISLKGNGYVKLNTASVPILSSMDYSLELWFKAAPNQTDAALVSNGKGDNSEGKGPQNNFFLGFEKKLLTFENNGYKIQTDGDYLDNNWHHVAIAVNRTSGIAQLYTDGILKNSFDASGLGGIAAASTYLGVRAWNNTDSITVTNFDRYFTGNIDEFRIWNTYLNKTLINKTNNVRLKGNEIGLMAYYPFEAYFTFQNNQQMAFSLKDQKIQDDPNNAVPAALTKNAAQSDEKAPIKDRGPVDNLKFDYVANNDGVIINMQEPKPAIDKTIVTFQVKNIRDKNGNAILSPITWTAYIDQNPLRWSDNSLNLTKANDSTMQFESYIVNSGGNIENFSLSNLPGWLTADILTGTVAPNGKQKISFTVNQALNIGSYDEVLFMRNDNAETQSLSLNMVVKGKRPDWVVNPAKFKYSMTIYGQLRINNLFSMDKEDLLGAFVNGKCIGLVNNAYNTQSDSWFTFMTLYNDSTVNNKVTFRIWQASTGKTFQALTSAGQIKFVNNSIAGTIRNPVIFDGSTITYEDISLNRGWNWVSFNVVNTATASSIDASLSNGKWASGDIIKNEELGFHQYSTTDGWMGTLSMLNNTSLFMLKTDTTQTLSMLGIAVDVTKTPIVVRNNRWNYISYLPQINLLLKDALAGYDAKNEDVIKSQNGFSMYDMKLGWIGSLTFMEPGKGYMLYRKQSNDTTFRYPAVKSFFKMEMATDKSVGNINLSQMPVSANSSYVQNMTVTAKAGSGMALQPGDIVLAYTAGEVRSKARLITNDVLKAPTLFFNISSDQEQQPVRFQVEREGKVIAETADILSFSANSQVGTLTKPLLLNFNKQAGTSITSFPNPFVKKVTVSMELTGALNKVHEIQLSVYNTAGQLIISFPRVKVRNRLFETSWNGKNASGMGAIPGIYMMVITIDGIQHFQKVIKN